MLDAAGEIYGDVANIAARVQALAEPGAVLVTARVQRQVAGLFVAEERGTHTLKGVPEPTALFRLVRASGGGRRSGQRNLTPLVGRDDEMAMLMRRWERARQGDGQLVLIVGEPGLGKSRLIEEFHARLADTPHTWVEWSCSQLLQNTPLHPIAEWGRQRFGGADVPPSGGSRSWKVRWRRSSSIRRRMRPLLAPLLDIPLPQGTRADFGARGIAAPATGGADQLGDGGRQGPAAGAGVRGSALGRSDHARRACAASPSAARWRRLFVVATTRPEFRPPWSMRSHHGTISLAPLDRAPGARHGGGAFRPPRAAARRGGGRRRAHRRRAAVRRGGDAASVGARRGRRRHRGDSADAAAIADGAARPARPGARGGADRLGDRPRLLLRR